MSRPALRIIDGDHAGFRQIVVETLQNRDFGKLDEAPLGQIRLDHRQRAKRDALPGQRGGAQQVEILEDRATDTPRLADQAKWISYGPARKSSAGLVGLYQDGKTEMAPHMPTNPANMKNALGSSYEFWVDHEAELAERFSAWLSLS